MLLTVKSSLLPKVEKVIASLNAKKATGVDNISARILKSCATANSSAMSGLINFSIKVCKIPDRIKGAQVVPLYKKKTPFVKKTITLWVCFLQYERFMSGQCTSSLQNTLTRFLTHFWLLSEKVMVATLPCCICWKTGEWLWMRVSV